MSLREMLQEEARGLLADCPEQAMRHYDRAAAQLRAEGIVEAAVGEGEMVPDFELADDQGRLISLQHALDRGPVVILWLLSVTGPLCRLALAAYRESLRPALSADASLLAISLQKASALDGSGFETSSGGYHLLTDPDGRVGALFGVLYAPSTELEEVFRCLRVDPVVLPGSGPVLPLAAIYVVDGDGIAAFAQVDVDPTCRAEPASISEAIGRLAAAS